MESTEIIKTMRTKLNTKSYTYIYKLSGLIPILYCLLHGIKAIQTPENRCNQAISFYLFFKHKCIEANPEVEPDFRELEEIAGIHPALE